MFHFSSIVVSHLKARYLKDLRKSIWYWSFDDTAKEVDDLEAMLRSLVFQIMPRGTPIPDFVHQTMQAYRCVAVNPPAYELSDLLQRICREARRDIYLIIDGLNQCGNKGHATRRAKLLTILHDVTACGLGNLHMLLASKGSDEIGAAITAMEFKKLTVDLNSAESPDLQSLVSYKLKHISYLRSMAHDERADFESRILAKAAR